jgi:toxin secretion/phage lysis holin
MLQEEIKVSYLSEFKAWAIGGAGSLYAFVTGHTDQAFKILLAMMLIDVISGLMRGAYQKRLKSAIMSMGIVKKGGVLLSIVFAGLLDHLVNDGQPVFRTMMVWLSIGNESLSICENLAAMGIAIPKVIKDRLAQIATDVELIQLEKDAKDKRKTQE